RVTIAALANLACIVAFLVLLDHMSKALRPVTLVARVAERGKEVIYEMYPQLFVASPDQPLPERKSTGEPDCVVAQTGASGVLEAFSAKRLVELAAAHDCVIELVPE